MVITVGDRHMGGGVAHGGGGKEMAHGGGAYGEGRRSVQGGRGSSSRGGEENGTWRGKRDLHRNVRP